MRCNSSRIGGLSLKACSTSGCCKKASIFGAMPPLRYTPPCARPSKARLPAQAAKRRANKARLAQAKGSPRSAAYFGAQTVDFRAGLELGLMRYGLAAFALLRRLRDFTRVGTAAQQHAASAQKAMDAFQAMAGQQQLLAGAPVGLLQGGAERQLLFIHGGKIGQAALARQHLPVLTATHQQGHAQASTGAEQRAHASGLELAGLQGAEVAGR